MNLAEYNAFGEELRESLEMQFNWHYSSGDKDAAFDDIQKLMEYRLISKDDPRCSTKFFSDQYSSHNMSIWDYNRKDVSNIIPKCLFCELVVQSFDTPTLPHWGIRVEGNYQGDIKVAANKAHVCVRPMFNGQAAFNALDELAKILNKAGIKSNNTDNLKVEAAGGLTRVFTIEVVGSILSKYRTLGVVLCKPRDDGKMLCAVAIKYEALYNSWIDIDRFMINLNDAIQRAVRFETVVQVGISPDKAKQIQAGMIKASEAKDDEARKIRERQELMEKQRAEEKKAARKTEQNHKKAAV